jgi:hypothetical protein
MLQLGSCAPQRASVAFTPNSTEIKPERQITEKEEPTKPPSEPSAPSLEDLICGATPCSLEEVRKLEDGSLVVRDTVDEKSPGPAHWLVHPGEDGSVSYQKLFFGYFQEDEPKEEGFWSTFSLKRRADGFWDLSGHESSPGGTAWGRDGSLTFSFPKGELLEWTYHFWHALNSSLSGSSEWSWLNLDTESSSALEIDLPEGFEDEDWKTADLSRCSIPLSGKRGEKKVLRGSALVARAKMTLFVELEVSQLRKQSSLQICSAGEFEPGPDSQYPGTVHCESFPVNSQGLVTKDGNHVKFKVQLPEITSHVSIILRDASKKAYYLSNDFNFKDAYTLDPLLTIAPEKGRCVLDEGALWPRLERLNPDRALFDQVM